MRVSEYLRARYQPIADDLLRQHGLSVDQQARDMLAGTIMHARTLPRDDPPRQHSPISNADSALRHARKLLQYAQTPPRRKESIPTRCESLLAALLEESPLPVALGIRLASSGAPLDYGALLDTLEARRIDVTAVSVLVDTLEAVTADREGWRRVGRPHGQAWAIVRAGCMVWRIAGRPRLGYRWNDVERSLTGVLPDFLRGLLACCNGTHELVRAMPSERLRRSSKGNGLRLSDSSLKLALIRCVKDKAMQNHLRQRAQKSQTYVT